MARTVVQVDYGCSREDAQKWAEQILIGDGYQKAEQDGEVVWIKGDVKLSGVRGIKVDYGENQLKLSGWIKGLIGGETPLHGIASVVIKRDVKKTMNKIEAAISKS